MGICEAYNEYKYNERYYKYNKYFRVLCVFLHKTFNSIYRKSFVRCSCEQIRYFPDMAILKVYLFNEKVYRYIVKYTELKKDSPLKHKFILSNGRRKFYLTDKDEPSEVLFKLFRFSEYDQDITNYINYLRYKAGIKAFSPEIFCNNISKHAEEIGLDYKISNVSVMNYGNKTDITIYAPNYPTIIIKKLCKYPSVSLNYDIIDLLLLDKFKDNTTIAKFNNLIKFIRKYTKYLFYKDFVFQSMEYQPQNMY